MDLWEAEDREPTEKETEDADSETFLRIMKWKPSGKKKKEPESAPTKPGGILRTRIMQANAAAAMAD
jgi:hypothetical protein